MAKHRIVMTTLTARVPDSIYNRIKSLADREEISIDQLVSMALSAQIAVMLTGESIAERAKRGNWKRAKEILAKAPAVEPEEIDKLK